MSRTAYLSSLYEPATYHTAIAGDPLIVSMQRDMAHMVARRIECNERVLEVGCGTGLLTNQLIKVARENLLVASDPDIESIGYARRVGSANLAKRWVVLDMLSPAVQGPFGIVVSSLADHHIRPTRKGDYFLAIRRLLATKGVFISGDEFIGDYRTEEDYARRLGEYHAYVISDAESRGAWEESQVERQAWLKGLEGEGEYKTSVTRYQELTRRAGLELACRIRIGPDVPGLLSTRAGVYIHVFSRS